MVECVCVCRFKAKEAARAGLPPVRTSWALDLLGCMLSLTCTLPMSSFLELQAKKLYEAHCCMGIPVAVVASIPHVFTCARRA